MAHVKGPDEATSEAELDSKKRKAIADQNEISQAQIGDQNFQDSPAEPRNRNSTQAELTKAKSGRLGTVPELAFGDLAHSKRVRSVNSIVAAPAPLKVRLSVTTGPGGSPVVAATGGQSSSIGTQSSSPSQALARPRPKPTSKGNSSSGYFFSSCFGSPAAGPAAQSSSSGKVRLPSQSSSSQARRQASPPLIVPGASDPSKPVVPVADPLTIAAQVPDSTTNSPPTASVVEAAAAAAEAANSPSQAALPEIPRSPSCSCSITTVKAETGQSLPLDPGNPTSMIKPENESGISSSQQVLNAQAAELIAALQRADEGHHETPAEPFVVEPSSESRQAAAGVSPIRGLRRRSETVRADPSARARRISFQDRASSPLHPNHGPSDTAHHSQAAYVDHRSRSPVPHVTASGVGRLFDVILGRGDLSQGTARSRSPLNRNNQMRLRSKIPNRRAPTSLSADRAWSDDDDKPTGAPTISFPDRVRGWSNDDEKLPTGAPTSSFAADRVRAWSDDDDKPTGAPTISFGDRLRALPDDDQSPRDPVPIKPPETSSGSRAQTYSEPANPPGQTSTSRGQEYAIDHLANLPETSNRDMDSDQLGVNQGSNPTGSRNPANEYGTFVDARAALRLSQEQRVSNLLASDVRWIKKDPYREVVERRKDPRRRGQPDPSFNPRPGDVIIRARKRAGLRLTDFYYYDNENYMEEGDQVLRAKFEYLPPMDKMYLWCRLYVYRADGTYTFLDQTSENVANFRTVDPADAKTFKKPSNFT